jgi:5-formyltetrahydrofolate cyclo-ligase
LTLLQLAGDGPDRVAGHRRGYFRSLNLIDTARRGYARVLLMESGGDAPESKSALRARMRRLMRGCVADSAPQCRELDSWLASHPAAETIAAYYPLPGEVDFTEIVRLHGRRRWVYPRVNGDEMVYHLVNDPDKDLTTGAFGVMEPRSSLPRVGIAGIDVFLCPGLAFDAHGGRLGRGKGYYDRALSRARPDAFRIGVCFPWQMVAAIPLDAQDIRMDLVIGGADA